MPGQQSSCGQQEGKRALHRDRRCESLCGRFLQGPREKTVCGPKDQLSEVLLEHLSNQVNFGLWVPRLWGWSRVTARAEGLPAPLGHALSQHQAHRGVRAGLASHTASPTASSLDTTTHQVQNECMHARSLQSCPTLRSYGL